MKIAGLSAVVTGGASGLGGAVAQMLASEGAKVAIFTFEDLECPACSRAFPIVQGAVEHYKIPLVRHDFPLKMHIWSFDAAVNARYLQDKVAPKTAEEYRGAVFACDRGESAPFVHG